MNKSIYVPHPLLHASYNYDAAFPNRHILTKRTLNIREILLILPPFPFLPSSHRHNNNNKPTFPSSLSLSRTLAR